MAPCAGPVAAEKRTSFMKAMRWAQAFVGRHPPLQASGSTQADRRLRPLRAAARQDRATLLRPHPRPETMLLLTTTVVGLKCTLHSSRPFRRPMNSLWVFGTDAGRRTKTVPGALLHEMGVEFKLELSTRS